MSRNTGCYDGLYLIYFLIVSYGRARVAPGQQKKKTAYSHFSQLLQEEKSGRLERLCSP